MACPHKTPADWLGWGSRIRKLERAFASDRRVELGRRLRPRTSERYVSGFPEAPIFGGPKKLVGTDTCEWLGERLHLRGGRRGSRQTRLLVDGRCQISHRGVEF